MSLHIDIHQHVWTPPLRDALAARTRLPRIELDGAEATVLCAGELPWRLDTAGEDPAARTALLDRDGLDAAIIAISSPIGIEALPREEALPLIWAQLDGVAALGPRFGAWGPLVTDRPVPEDVDALVTRGVVGISIAAGAIASPDRLTTLAPVLRRVHEHGLALFVHPGRAHADLAPSPRQTDPLWWPALTDYVTQMQAAWLVWASRGRREHPGLRIVFAMLAGLAPLQHERLRTRGGPPIPSEDPDTFYDTSSYGADAIAALSRLVGPAQLLYGSDRPVLEPLATPGDRLRQQRAGTLLGAAFSRPASRHPADPDPFITP